jgi:hypothetical protein
LRKLPWRTAVDAVMPADARVRERLAVLCLALLAASGRDLAGVAEGEALERLAAIVGDGRG